MKTKKTVEIGPDFLFESSKMELAVGIVFMAILLAMATESFGQNAIPPGTILPLQLNTSLNSRKSKSGQVVTARVMQDDRCRRAGGFAQGRKRSLECLTYPKQGTEGERESLCASTHWKFRSDGFP
jgi:hypothetical protein